MMLFVQSYEPALFFFPCIINFGCSAELPKRDEATQQRISYYKSINRVGRERKLTILLFQQDLWLASPEQCNDSVTSDSVKFPDGRCRRLLVDPLPFRGPVGSWTPLEGHCTLLTKPLLKCIRPPRAQQQQPQPQHRQHGWPAQYQVRCATEVTFSIWFPSARLHREDRAGRAGGSPRSILRRRRGVIHTWYFNVTESGQIDSDKYLPED